MKNSNDITAFYNSTHSIISRASSIGRHGLKNHSKLKLWRKLKWFKTINKKTIMCKFLSIAFWSDAPSIIDWHFLPTTYWFQDIQSVSNDKIFWGRGLPEKIQILQISSIQCDRFMLCVLTIDCWVTLVCKGLGVGLGGVYLVSQTPPHLFFPYPPPSPPWGQRSKPSC